MKYDIGLIVDLKKVDDRQKFALLSEHFVPELDYQFPTKMQGLQKRKCTKSMLSGSFVYSESKDSVWCPPCALFRRESRGKNNQESRGNSAKVK